MSNNTNVIVIEKGEKGNPAPDTIFEYSVDGMSNWHPQATAVDQFVRQSGDNGTTWNGAIHIAGLSTIFAKFDEKFDKSNIAQELGDDADKVVSQAALNEIIGLETPWQNLASGYGMRVMKNRIGEVIFDVAHTRPTGTYIYAAEMPNGFRPSGTVTSVVALPGGGVGYVICRANGDVEVKCNQPDSVYASIVYNPA
ncbi:MAG: hypothetical protein ACRC3G_01965 [Bacteroidales bacterium]